VRVFAKEMTFSLVEFAYGGASPSRGDEYVHVQ
jgi:hypothetical protein